MQHCLGSLTDLNATSKVLRSSQETVVASSIYKYLLNKENVCTILSLGIGSTSVDLEFLKCLFNAFSLSISEKVIVGLPSPKNPLIRLQGKNFSTPLIDQLCASPVNPTNQNYHIIEVLSLSRSLSNHVSLITKMISLDKSQDRAIRLVQGQLNEVSSHSFPENCDTDYDFISGEMDMGRSPSDILLELSYGCTVNTALCMDVLSHF